MTLLFMKPKSFVPLLLAAFIGLAQACALRAELELSGLFADHMVMQRLTPVPVWGRATPGATVAVTIDDQRKTAVADAAGKWLVRLDPMGVGAPRTMRVVSGGATAEVGDILLGDVWICAGQSNMEWPLQNTTGAAEEIATANHPEIRLFEVGNGVSPTTRQDTLIPKPGATWNGWAVCSPRSAKGFSAAGYYFGKILNRDLGVPVGLVFNAVGATPIESWISREMLASDPELKPALDYWDRADAFAETPEGKAQLQVVYDKYDELQAAARKAGKHVWRQSGYNHPLKRTSHASTLFNGRVAPLIPFAIKGVIWYQGEGNTGAAYEYRRQFPALIQDWRNQWGQGDFPFLFVQLANWGGPPPAAPVESEWAELREAQTLALKLKNTGMAVAVDIGDPANIHPANKRDVGARLALAAKAVAYGERIVASGPMFKGHAIEGGKIRVRFDSTGGGLVAKGGALRSFAIAGEDRRFVRAKAEIDGDTVLVSSDAVKQPVAVRYGWHNNPDCNLYNAEMLPASPFRTDSWPGITDKKGFREKAGKPIRFEAPRTNS